jgi:hypothetical protein
MSPLGILTCRKFSLQLGKFSGTARFESVMVNDEWEVMRMLPVFTYSSGGTLIRIASLQLGLQMVTSQYGIDPLPVSVLVDEGSFQSEIRLNKWCEMVRPT